MITAILRTWNEGRGAWAVGFVIVCGVILIDGLEEDLCRVAQRLEGALS